MKKKNDLTGPTGVAQILQRLSSPHRNRLLDAISSQSPDIATEIRGALLSFDEIVALTDQSIQTIVSEVPQETLAKALRGADKALISRVLSCLSSRRREILSEEIMRIPPVPKAESVASQREIALRMEALHAAGKIRTLTSDDDVIE